MFDKHHIYLYPMDHDHHAYGNNLNENYSAKYGYRWLTQEYSLETNQGARSWIWKLKALENLWFFIWQLCHNSIPMMSVGLLVESMSHQGVTDAILTMKQSSNVFRIVLNHWHSGKPWASTTMNSFKTLRNPIKAGYRELLRDIMGSWISGFMGSTGISNNLHTKLLGLLYGLQMA
ncbi:hypothetical protein Lal_00004699 [Lupinus albus]|nr:hypothetical protein Lal_00004699 [Lupinus albus]